MLKRSQRLLGFMYLTFLVWLLFIIGSLIIYLAVPPSDQLRFYALAGAIPVAMSIVDLFLKYLGKDEPPPVLQSGSQPSGPTTFIAEQTIYQGIPISTFEELQKEVSLLRKEVERLQAAPHETTLSEAAELAQKLAGLTTEHVATIARLADEYIEQTRWSDALIQTNKLLTYMPSAPHLYYNRGLLNQNQGNLAASIADYTEAIRLAPWDALSFNNRGAAWHMKGELTNAIKDYDKAIQIDSLLAGAYVNRGKAYYDQGILDEASNDFQTAVNLDPNFAIAYNNIGLVHRKFGDPTKAIAAYDKAIFLNPRYAKAYVNRGFAWVAMGDLNKAFDDYTEAIQIDKDYAAAYYNRGLIHRRWENLEDAIADYSQAIRCSPQMALAYNNRGNIYASLGNFDGAIADYGKAIALDPQFVSAYYNRGIAFKYKGEFATAVLDFSKVIDLDTKDATAYDNRGQIHFLLMQLQKAKRDYQSALDLNPAFQRSRAGLAITMSSLQQIADAIAVWKSLIKNDARYRDADWVGRELEWRPELVEAARKLIAELGD